MRVAFTTFDIFHLYLQDVMFIHSVLNAKEITLFEDQFSPI
jgi:hypothetical protein